MFSRRKMLAGLGAIATTAAARIPIDGIVRRSGATTIGSITMSGDSLFFAIGEELWRYQTDLNLWTQIDSAVNK